MVGKNNAGGGGEEARQRRRSGVVSRNPRSQKGLKTRLKHEEWCQTFGWTGMGPEATIKEVKEANINKF